MQFKTYHFVFLYEHTNEVCNGQDASPEVKLY